LEDCIGGLSWKEGTYRQHHVLEAELVQRKEMFDENRRHVSCGGGQPALTQLDQSPHPLHNRGWLDSKQGLPSRSPRYAIMYSSLTFICTCTPNSPWSQKQLPSALPMRSFWSNYNQRRFANLNPVLEACLSRHAAVLLKLRQESSSRLFRESVLLKRRFSFRFSFLTFKEGSSMISDNAQHMFDMDTTNDTPNIGTATRQQISFCMETVKSGKYSRVQGGNQTREGSLGDHIRNQLHGLDTTPSRIYDLGICSSAPRATFTLHRRPRLSDMYGGYPIFMIAVLWLCIWSVIAGFSSSLIVVDICRAMQGLAIAAYTPSSFALFGAIYPNGPRKNLVLGIYAACSPLGFFVGILVAAALPADKWNWWFWIATIMSFVALVSAYVSVPSDRADRQQLNLNMDWSGTVTITSGLILVAYALAASSGSLSAWKTPGFLVPFIIGIICLALALYVELWWAKCPLLPKKFFEPTCVLPLMTACVFFYGSFGTWLFTTTSHLTLAYGVTGIRMAWWCAPLAVGGILCGLVSGRLIHHGSPTWTLVISGVAWVAAPLLLALGSTSMGYWPFVFPAMVCATVGVDITYNIANLVLSSLSPLKWQGLAGAVNSTTVNLGIAFSLAITQVIQTATEGKDPMLPSDLRLQLLVLEFQETVFGRRRTITNGPRVRILRCRDFPLTALNQKWCVRGNKSIIPIPSFCKITDNPNAIIEHSGYYWIKDTTTELQRTLTTSSR
ncbi:MFS general substrate transporter, partial [Aureobasidium melanogenum]